MRQSVTYKEKSEGFANQTFRLLLVGRSRSGFSSPDSDTYYTLGLAVKTITESSMKYLLPGESTLAASAGPHQRHAAVGRDLEAETPQHVLVRPARVGETHL